MKSMPGGYRLCDAQPAALDGRVGALLIACCQQGHHPRWRERLEGRAVI